MENTTEKLITIFLILSSFISYSQEFDQYDSDLLAYRVDSILAGSTLTEDLKLQGVDSESRTIVYKYEVSYPTAITQDIKEIFINNLKEMGLTDFYFKNNIKLKLEYYYNERLIKNVNIGARELSGYEISLGSFVDLSGHPKAKGVNLKIKAPKGWEVQEGVGPNIIKKFVIDNSYFSIMVRENMKFFSRNQSRDLLNDEEYTRSLSTGLMSSLTDSKLINESIITLGGYPAYQVEITGRKDRSGLQYEYSGLYWIVFFEDKLVTLSFSSRMKHEFEALKVLAYLVADSLVMIDKYK